ncbi:MAG: hypothetical protein KC496_08025 [Anaerolineae bacterium]|nr:hypothetical protein [Anaerolineae bacterium]
MSHQWEQIISVFLAVMGFTTAVIAGINQFIKLRENMQPRNKDTLSALEDDVDRLESQVQEQGRDIEKLKQGLESSSDNALSVTLSGYQFLSR